MTESVKQPMLRRAVPQSTGTVMIDLDVTRLRIDCLTLRQSGVTQKMVDQARIRTLSFLILKKTYCQSAIKQINGTTSSENEQHLESAGEEVTKPSADSPIVDTEDMLAIMQQRQTSKTQGGFWLLMKKMVHGIKVTKLTANTVTTILLLLERSRLRQGKAAMLT